MARSDVTCDGREIVSIRRNRVRTWIELRHPGELGASVTIELLPEQAARLADLLAGDDPEAGRLDG